MKVYCRKISLFLFSFLLLTVLSVSLSSCDEEDQDAYIDIRGFEGSWYHKGTSDTIVVVSFFRSIVYKDIMIDGEIVEHTDFGMIESVSKTTLRVNGKTSEYRFGSGKLFLKEVILPNETNNNDWMEFVQGDPLYGY